MPARQSQITFVLLVTLGLNWIVAVAKLAVGLIAGNLTVLGDALHSFLDGANNVVGIVAIRHASRPPDKEHPYGHRKFENLAAMMIGGMLVLMCWEMLENISVRVYSHLRGGVPMEESAVPEAWQVAIVIGALVVNLFVSWYERRAGRRLHSSLLTADAAHTFSDSLVTLLGLASLLVSPLAWWVDPILALAVLAFLVRAAWGIIAENASALIDSQRYDPEDVRRVAEGVDGVLSTDQIRSHGATNDVHIDLHIVVADNLTARQAEDIEQAVRSTLCSHFDGITLVSIEHRTASGEAIGLPAPRD